MSAQNPAPGTKHKLTSRFAAVRFRAAHRDYERSKPEPQEWLRIEWPREEAAPTQYWLSTVPEDGKLAELLLLAKHRWIIERDYEERKQELGLGHFEGRGWRGFHHHATLCIAAYGFLVSERSRFPPSARPGRLDLRVPTIPPDFQPRGSPRAGRAASSALHRNPAGNLLLGNPEAVEFPFDAHQKQSQFGVNVVVGMHDVAVVLEDKFGDARHQSALIGATDKQDRGGIHRLRLLYEGLPWDAVTTSVKACAARVRWRSVR